MENKIVIFLLTFVFLFCPNVLHADSEWIVVTVDHLGDVGRFTSIDLNDYGEPYISYSDETDGNLKYAYYAGDNEWRFHSFDESGVVNSSTSIEVEGCCYPHISYIDGDTGYLMYARWNEAVNFRVSVVDNSIDGGKSTSLSLDKNNNPHISYIDKHTDSLKYAYWDGGKWIIETVDNNIEFSSTSLQFDSQYNPHISYYGYSNPLNLKYAFWNGENWTIEIVDEKFISPWCSNCISLALDDENQAHISYGAYTYNTSTQLKYATQENNTWQNSTLDSPDSGWYLSIALDSNEFPHISYYDYEYYDLKYCYWNGDNWMIDTISQYGYDTSIALDESDNVHISYYHAGMKALMYATTASNLFTAPSKQNPNNMIYLGVIVGAIILLITGFTSRLTFSKKKRKVKMIQSSTKKTKKHPLESLRDQTKSENENKIITEYERVLDEFNNLKNKSHQIKIDDIDRLFKDNELEEALTLIKKRTKEYDKFQKHKTEIKDIQQSINELTTRVANGKLSSDAFSTANTNLERKKRDLEEQLWKLRNKLFKDEYEKPF